MKILPGKIRIVINKKITYLIKGEGLLCKIFHLQWEVKSYHSFWNLFRNYEKSVKTSFIFFSKLIKIPFVSYDLKTNLRRVVYFYSVKRLRWWNELCPISVVWERIEIFFNEMIFQVYFVAVKRLRIDGVRKWDEIEVSLSSSLSLAHSLSFSLSLSLAKRLFNHV